MTEKENVIRTITRDHPAWIPYRYHSILTLQSKILRVRPVDGGRDDWGINWIPTTEVEGSYIDRNSHLDIEAIAELRVSETDWELVTNDLKKQIEANKQVDKLILVYNELPLFDRAQAILGMEECLMATVLHPGKFELLLDKITEYQLKLTEAIMKSGTEGVRFTDDWGMQDRLLISPAQWRVFIKPRLSKLYEVVKKYNGFVFQHSCGHIEEIVPDLIEIGCDVLDPIQPAANDIYRLKKEYGKDLCFMGGLDTQTYLSFGSPEEVEEAVKKVLLVMSEGGGYIAAPSHTISIPEANQTAMLEAINEVNKIKYGVSN